MQKSTRKNIKPILMFVCFFTLSTYSAGQQTPEITSEMYQKTKALVNLYEYSCRLAQEDLSGISAEKHVQRLLGYSRKWWWNASGTIEKLWCSTTPYHFKWKTVEENPGTLGALENRKARFLWEHDKQRVLDLHAITVANLSQVFTKLKTTNCSLWDHLLNDPYQSHNYNTFQSHSLNLDNATKALCATSISRESVRKTKSNERRQKYSRLGNEKNQRVINLPPLD